MKAKQFFAITALGAALFASCSNEEELANRAAILATTSSVLLPE